MPRQTKKQKKKFKGDLIKAIKFKAPPVHPGILIDKEEYRKKYEKELADISKANFEHFIKERNRKLGLMFKHYEINQGQESSWQVLACCLADDFVDGFQVQVEKQTGRKVTWSDELLAKLWIDVNSKKENGKHSVARTCQFLIKQQPWQQMKVSAKTLENKYLEAENSTFVRMYKEIEPAGHKMMENLIEKLCSSN